MIGIGLIRLALALTVVITHTHSIFGFTLGNPVIAVRAFFVISGFYMSLVLNEKYHSYKLFITNRFLKIFPIYWLILFLTIISCIGAYLIRNNWGEMADFVKYISTMSPLTLALIIAPHFTIFGRSLVMFSDFNPAIGALVFYPKLPDLVSGINFLLVPQAWTLVIELWFYLLAPFIVKKSYITIVALIVISIMMRILLKEIGLVGDMWVYRFFPTELSYFLLGWFGYKIFKLFRHSVTLNILGAISAPLAILLLSIYNYRSVDAPVPEWLFYGILVFLIPLAFNYSKNSKLDRLIGDLSYPVYITHILVNNIVNPLLLINYIPNRNFQAPIVFGFSVVLSLLLNKYIQRPIDKIREIRIKS